MISAIAFVVLAAIGVPIAFVLGWMGLIQVFFYGGSLSFLEIMPQRLFDAVDSFTLIAIPFFVLVGELMNRSGTAERLIQLARCLVGRFKGGMGYANIASGAVMAAIMGSAAAEAAARAPILVPAMEKDGYDRELAVAITAAGSLLGPIIPPSMVFIVYGVTAGVSISAMFIGGILPGILLTFMLFSLVWFIVRKRKLVTSYRASRKEIWVTFISSLPALVIPVIIVGGILIGLFTPTESALIACIWILLIDRLFFKELSIEAIKESLMSTGIVSASVLLVMAAANIFAWLLAVDRVPQAVMQLIGSITSTPWIILLFINIFLLIVGMFMDGLAAIPILVPVFYPIVIQMGWDPVHFGLMVSVNLIVGLITPPVGLVIFTVSSICNVSLEKTTRALLPFIYLMVLYIFIIAFWPSLSLFLPKTMGLIH